MLVVSVLMLLAVSQSQAQDCRCNDFINKNGYGQCKKKLRGKLLCYVDKPSSCKDLWGSGTNPGMILSYEACKPKPAEPSQTADFVNYAISENVARCSGSTSVKDASECLRAAVSLGYTGRIESGFYRTYPGGCIRNKNNGKLYFNRFTQGGSRSNLQVICKRGFPAVQCKGKWEPHDILLAGPGNKNRIEISSPNYPSSYSTSSLLSCSWNFKAQYSANVSITVEESNWKNCNPTDNVLKIHDDSNDGTLGYPGLKATCAPTGFPKAGWSVSSNDETTVEFQSGSANNGDISFKLIVQSTGATISPPKTSINKCPNGPCCVGTNCCVYELGTIPTNITSPGYPGISQKDLLCTYKLRTVQGSRIAFNFLELDMLHSESCNKDFVKLQDTAAANSPSLIGRTGITFCGRQLPNSPGPSVLVSDNNELTVTYRTGKNVEAMRGRGFKASVAAVNPYLEPMTYTHTYGDYECSPECGGTHNITEPPTPPVNPPCEAIPIVVTIMDKETSTPISGAKVSATTVQTVSSSSSTSFVATTTADGKINKDLPRNTKYQITVTKEGYEAQTEGLDSACSNSDCEACAKIIKLIMVPVKIEPNTTVCPEGMTGGVQVIDELSKKPITGAVVNVIENGDTPVVTDVETDLEGKVILPLTTNGSYSINVTKEGYDSVLLDEVEHNCTLSIVAELPQPVCKIDNVTITLNVHVKDKETDDGIEGASVNVYANGNANAINEDPLIADANGKVALTVANSGSYKVEVQAEGIHSKQEDVDVICDKTKCENCTTLAILELEKMEEKPVCNETKLAVQTVDVATEVGVDAVVTITFIPDTGNQVIVASRSEVGANGNLNMPIEGNGKYVVLASAVGYMDNTKTLVVNCSTEDCSDCKPSIKVPLEKEICTEIEFKIKVTDELTNNPIPSAKVVAKLITENGTEVVTSKGKDYMVTDEDGRIEVPIVEEAKYTVEITKEGYEPYGGNETIECGDMKAGHVCPCQHALTVGMNQVFCNKTITMDITISTEKDAAVPNANVVILLTSSVAGASSTNVGGKLTTDANGVVSSPIFTSGTYQITVEADGYMDRTVKMDIENSTACDHIRIPLNVTIIEQPEEYCQDVPMTVTVMDKNTNIPIPSAAVDITLGENNFVTPNVQVADGILTDANGKIEVSVSLGGNYDVYVTKSGYLPLNGTAVVNCDINNCKSCSVTVELDMDQPRCPAVVLPVTITDEDTGKPIESAKVKLVLIGSLSGPSILDVGSPKFTDATGTATFDVDMNGNYSIRIEADGYDKKNLPLNIDCNPEHCKGCVPMAKTTLKKKFCEDKTFEFIVRNSITNDPATGAVVSVTKQVEEYGPTEIASLTVPSTGRVDVPIDGNGIYRAEISLAGYETLRTSYEVDITLEQCELLAPVELQPMSPSLPCDDGIRISLSWGENPKDLDLYANQVNKNTSKDECLTYYCDGKESCPGSNFDVDNKAGGYKGSETITFCDNDQYVQMVYVDDLSGKGASLLKSGAKLVIVSKTETKTIHLDPSDANAPARYWLAGCLTMKKGQFDWIEVNQFMDRKPHTEEPLHCYNRNLLKESDQNKDPKEYKIVTRASDDFGENNLVRISSNLASVTKRIDGTHSAEFTAPQGLYTVDVTSDGYIPVQKDVIVHSLTAKNNVVDVDFNMLPQHAPTSVNLLLEWPKSKEWPERNLDLYTLKVNKANSLETCKTNYNKKDGCKDVSLDKNDYLGGSNGGETITVNNTDASSANTFLIYARDSTSTGYSIETSGGQLTIANGKKILVESLPKAALNGAKWWLIGCMQTNSDGFDFVPLGKYSRKNPYNTGDKLKCHDLFKTYAPPPAEPFCKDAALKVGVYDSVTNAVVPNAIVTIKVDGSTFSQIVPTVGDTNPIKMNGEYIVSANAPGYVSKIESTTVKCDPSDCGNCKPSILLYLSPALSSPQFRLTLAWDQGDHELDMFVVQRNPKDLSYTCTTSTDGDANCNGVSLNSGKNVETVTFSNSGPMVHMVYIRDKPCEGPQDFVRSHPKISITDGKLTSELETNIALYNNNKYWLAACIDQLGNAVPAYKFSPVNIFLNEQPDIEVPDQCLYQLGYDVPAPTVKKWNILKKSDWLG